MTARLRVFLVDDEPLALRRLARMLESTGRVEITGSATDPETALAALSVAKVDALFLDIEMPGLSGFELLAKLPVQPFVIFTTAYDRYALRAFAENSVDYLLKPVEAEELDRAIGKLERMRAGDEGWDSGAVMAMLKTALKRKGPGYPARIASRLGERVQLVELSRVSHFIARDKLTYAVTEEKQFVVDSTITELEQKLDPERFVRLHRAVLLNVDFAAEVRTPFGGMVVRLKDSRGSELKVARDRIRLVKQRLGV